MPGLPTYDLVAVENTQGSDLPGQVAAWTNHYSNATGKYGFVIPSGVAPATYSANSRALQVRGPGSVDEWWFLMSFIAPPDSDWGAGGQGGVIRNWHNVFGDVGNGDIYNGVRDSSGSPPNADPVSALHLAYLDNHRVRTTLAAPYSGGSTMQLVSTVGLRASFGEIRLGDSHRKDAVSFTGISGNTLTGCTYRVPKGKTSGGAAVFAAVTWPVGTLVDGPEGGLRLNFEHYISGGGYCSLPDPVPAQRYDLVVHVIFGRNDNLDPTMPAAMRSARAGAIQIWANNGSISPAASDTPVLDLTNACILQRTDNYYKAPGTTYVQQFTDFWDTGPYVFPIPYSTATGGSHVSTDTGPWKYRTAATRFGSGASGLTEAVADMPIASGTRSPGTPGIEPGFFFNNDGNWGIDAAGNAHGTQNHHIAGTSPDLGAFTLNMSRNAAGVYTPTVPTQITTEGFQMPPSLGGTTTPTPPALTTQPVVSGAPVVGNTLTCPDGTWSGSPAPTIAKQWQFSYDGLNWFNLAGATGNTLALVAAYAGLIFRVSLVGTNASGSASGFSTVTSEVAQTDGTWLPNGTFDVDLSGWDALNGATITRVTSGTFSGAGALKIVTAGSVGFEGVRTQVVQSIYLPAGTARVLTAQIKAPVSASIRMVVNTFDQTGQLIRTSPTEAAVVADGAYHQARIVVPAASSAGSNTISISTGGTVQALNAIFVDAVAFSDFTVTPTTPTVSQATSNPPCTNAAAATTISCPVTVTANASRALYVAVVYDDKTRPVVSSGVKLDGTTAFTLVKKGAPTNGPNVEWWRLLNPPSGAHTINVTNSSTVKYVAGYIELANVNQSTPEPTGHTSAVSNAAGSNAPSGSVTSAQNELVLAGVAFGSNSGEVLTPLAGQTDKWNARNYSGTFGVHGAAATKPGDVSVSAGWTANATQPWTVAMVSVAGLPVGSPPVNSAAPVITGSATSGVTLTTDDGTWTNSPTSLSYEWQRDTAGNGVYAAIPLATSRTYTLQLGDVGNKVRVVVTASNQAGFASAPSTATALVAGIAPVLVTQPAAFGPTNIGATLATTDGIWSNAPTSYSYQWYRDNGANGPITSLIGGATASTHVVTGLEDNCRFLCAVTATNASGSSSPANSTAVGPVGPANALDTFNRADENPLSGGGLWQSPIQAAQAVLELVGNEVQGTIDSASQAYRTDVVDSNLVTEVQVKTLPNTAGRGVSVYARIQNPNNATTQRAYLWVYILGSGFRFFYFHGPGDNFDPLGSYDATHTLLAGESIRFELVGTTLTGYYREAPDPVTGADGPLHVVTTLTNSSITGLGTIGFESNDIDARLDNFRGGEFNVAVPTNTAVPTVTSSDGYHTGDTLTTTDGVWDGSPSLFAYQWQRDVGGNGIYADVPGQVAQTYLLSDGDIGNHLRSSVVATNRAGDSLAAVSAPTQTINAIDPTNVTAPVVSGSTTIHQTLSCTTGIWTGDPLPKFTYQWQRSLTPDDESSWRDIAAATANTYLLSTPDYLNYIRCEVTASNGGTPLTVPSNAVGPIRRILRISSQGGPLSWLDVSGVEVANAARTVEYLRSGLGDTVSGRWELGSGDVCGVLYRTPASGGACDDPAIFASPTVDPAPWYDPNDAGSASFLGVILTDVEGYDGTALRTITPRYGGLSGGTLGGARRNPRTWTFKAVLVSTDDAGAEYGLRWLTHVLQGPSCDGCSTGDVTVRLTCPDPNCLNDNQGLWTSYEVALTDGPHETVKYAPGFDPDALAGCREWVEVSWTMTAGNPYLYQPESASTQPVVLGAFQTCAGICDYLFGPAGDRVFVPTSTPARGTVAPIFTFESVSGCGPILCESYEGDCTNPANVPVAALQISGVPAGGAVVVDCARREITRFDPDGHGNLVASDGKGLIELAEGTPLSWPECQFCDTITCFSARTAHPCSQGGDTTVSIATQLREG